MFNADVDFEPYRAALAQRGRVRIAAALDPALADRLHDTLAAMRDWDLAIGDRAGARLVAAPQIRDRAHRDDLVRGVAADARGTYAFAYDSCMMVERYLQRAEPGHLLHAMVERLHDPAVLAFVQRLTGDAAIRRVLVQATRYLPGHFLRRHDDINDPGQDRRYAFVINLSRGWQADWGGLLQFLDRDGEVIDTLLPTFGSLTLFRVPQSHAVSQVAPWAESPRYALTGWFMA
jgi:Rps23 Pro-64 3,4-dihydroxylase Tpa1-like proline 4-hydroxylase